MLTGFHATNRKRKVDIRDKCDRLRLDFAAETDEERVHLAELRTALSRNMARDKRVIRIDIQHEA